MLAVMEAQVKSLDIDDFILNYDDGHLEFVWNVKYLEMFITVIPHCIYTFDVFVKLHIIMNRIE